MNLEAQNWKPGRMVMVAAAGLALAVLTAGCPKRAQPSDPCADACGGHGQEGTADAHAGHAHATAKPEGGKTAAAPDAHAGEAAGDGCEDEVVLTPQAIAANGVVAEPVSMREVRERFTLPARVAFDPERTAHVGTPVAGRVKEVRVRVGDTVKRGDPLLVVEGAAAAEAQSAYLQKKMQEKTAASALRLAAAAADRGGKLREAGALAAADSARRDAERGAAENVLAAAVAERLAAENTLRLLGFDDAALAELEAKGAVTPSCTIRAPVDGTVVEREATPGEMVGPEREALVRLADAEALCVLADAPENRLAEVATGAEAEITVDALGGGTFPGKVVRAAPALDEATRTARVQVAPDGAAAAGKRLRAGMFARATVAGPSTGGPVLAVPEAAVLTVEGGPAVFVAVEGEPGAFQKRAIVPGPAAGGWIPVRSGLKEGERVVVSGAFLLKAELAKGMMEGKTCTGH